MLKILFYIIDNQRIKSKLGLVLILISLFFPACGDKVNWKETYEHDTNDTNQNPFDVSILRQAITTEQMPVSDINQKLAFALPKEGTGENYIFIGEAMELDSNDARALRNFIERGNTAFIASKYISQRLLKNYLNTKGIGHIEEEVENTTENETAQVEEFTNLEEDSLASETAETLTLPEQEASFLNTMESSEYQIFKDSNLLVRVFLPDTFHFQTGYYNALGKNHFGVEHRYFNHFFNHNFLKNARKLGDLQREYANFLVLPYGKGQLFIHSTPILFTNVEMIEQAGKTLAEKTLAHLPTGKIYWDKGNQTDISSARRLDIDAPDEKSANNILKYVIGHASLASAWYVILGTTLLFFVFGAKRRQRIIPVLAGKQNTSLTYLQALGRLYFQKQNHTQLANMKLRYFLSFVRQRYGIKTTALDEAFTIRLSQKSGISVTEIRKLVKDSNYVLEQGIDEVYLAEYHQTVQYFYKNCK